MLLHAKYFIDMIIHIHKISGTRQILDTSINRQLFQPLCFRNLIGAQIDAEQKLSIGQLFFDTEKLTANENDLLKVKLIIYWTTIL